MDLSGVNKYSFRVLVLLTVFWSSFGGLWIGMGIDEWIFARLQYRWVGSLMMGLVALALGIFYAVVLVRRTRRNDEPSRKQPSASRLPGRES